jgi:hypothetical protein
MSIRFAALENFDQDVYSNLLLDIIRENIRIYEKNLKCCKPRFEVESSKLLYKRDKAKFQWLQNKSQINGEDMKNAWY